jgi:hypothetical protein
VHPDQPHDRFKIKKDRSVAGELTTGRITIEDGVYIEGTIEIERGSAKVATDSDTFVASAEIDFNRSPFGQRAPVNRDELSFEYAIRTAVRYS